MLKLNLNKRYLTLSLFMAALMLCADESPNDFGKNH